ncbi:hypothetical protein Tco_1065861 [Tanacetum coccineum]
MDKSNTLKSVLKTTSKDPAGIAAKVNNIEGKLRMPMRNVSFDKPVHASKVSIVEGCEGHDTPVGPTSVGASSFASVLSNSQGKKSVKISEMHNMEAVDGAKVVIPMKETLQTVGYFISIQQLQLNGWPVEMTSLRGQNRPITKHGQTPTILEIVVSTPGITSADAGISNHKSRRWNLLCIYMIYYIPGWAYVSNHGDAKDATNAEAKSIMIPAIVKAR